LGEDGNIVVTVPPGEHLLTVRFLATPVRQWADWTSLLAWLLLLFLLIPNKKLAITGKNLRKKDKSKL
jgi:hypothetical protein